MRHMIGSGTPRGLQDRMATVITSLLLHRGVSRSDWSHSRGALVSVTYHHYRQLLSRDNLHHGLVKAVRAARYSRT